MLACQPAQLELTQTELPASLALPLVELAQTPKPAHHAPRDTLAQINALLPVPLDHMATAIPTPVSPVTQPAQLALAVRSRSAQDATTDTSCRVQLVNLDVLLDSSSTTENVHRAHQIAINAPTDKPALLALTIST